MPKDETIRGAGEAPWLEQAREQENAEDRVHGHEGAATIPDTLEADGGEGGGTQAMDECDHEAEMCLEGEAAGENVAGSEMDHAMDLEEDLGNDDDGEPYRAPAEWQRFLGTWHDPAIGAGLEDSALSGGEFERPLPHEACPGEPGSGQEVDQGAEGSGALGTSGPSGSSVRRGTVSSEPGPKQATLKSWLK